MFGGKYLQELNEKLQTLTEGVSTNIKDHLGIAGELPCRFVLMVASSAFIA